MPRIGVIYDQVAATADGLVADSINPTIKNVRERLGTGSGNTIHKHLSLWKSTCPQFSGESINLPKTIILAISKEIERATSEPASVPLRTALQKTLYLMSPLLSVRQSKTIEILS